jgi:hypothetical protein
MNSQPYTKINNVWRIIVKIKVSELKKQLNRYNQKDLVELVVEILKIIKMFKTSYPVNF